MSHPLRLVHSSPTPPSSPSSTASQMPLFKPTSASLTPWSGLESLMKKMATLKQQRPHGFAHVVKIVDALLDED